MPYRPPVVPHGPDIIDAEYSVVRVPTPPTPRRLTYDPSALVPARGTSALTPHAYRLDNSTRSAPPPNDAIDVEYDLGLRRPRQLDYDRSSVNARFAREQANVDDRARQEQYQRQSRR